MSNADIKCDGGALFVQAANHVLQDHVPPDRRPANERPPVFCGGESIEKRNLYRSCWNFSDSGKKTIHAFSYMNTACKDNKKGLFFHKEAGFHLKSRFGFAGKAKAQSTPPPPSYNPCDFNKLIRLKEKRASFAPGLESKKKTAGVKLQAGFAQNPWDRAGVNFMEKAKALRDKISKAANKMEAKRIVSIPVDAGFALKIQIQRNPLSLANQEGFHLSEKNRIRTETTSKKSISSRFKPPLKKSYKHF